MPKDLLRLLSNDHSSGGKRRVNETFRQENAFKVILLQFGLYEEKYRRYEARKMVAEEF